MSEIIGIWKIVQTGNVAPYIRANDIQFGGFVRTRADFEQSFPVYWHKIDTNFTQEQLQSLTVSASSIMSTNGIVSNSDEPPMPVFSHLTTNCGTTNTDVMFNDCYIPIGYLNSNIPATASSSQTIYIKSGNTVLTSFNTTIYGRYQSYGNKCVLSDKYSTATTFNIVAESADTAATIDVVCNYDRANWGYNSGTTFDGIVTGASGWTMYEIGNNFDSINRVTIYFSSASTSNIETGSAVVSLNDGRGSSGSITINLTRKGLDIPYLHWTYNDSTDISTSISSANTIMACGYTVHNVDSFTLSSDTPLNSIRVVGNTIEANVPVNTGLAYRTIHVYAKSGSTILATWTITQAGSAYMYWDSSGTNTAKTISDIASGGTSGSLTIRTNETTLSTASTVNWIHVTPTTSSVLYVIDTNTTAMNRSGTVTITGYYGASITLTVNQIAGEAYVYLISGSTTNATTYTTAVLSNAGQTTSVGINTNGDNAWLNSNVTVTRSDTWITVNSLTSSAINFRVALRDVACSSSQRSGTITLSRTGGPTLTITVRQQAADTYYFNGSDVTVNYTQHQDSASYTSNISQGALSFTADDSWVSNISASGGRIYFDVSANGTSSRSTYINVYNGYCSNAYVGRFRVTQQEISDWLNFCDTSTTTMTINVPATARTPFVCISTSYSTLTTGGTDITNVTTSSTRMTVSIPPNTNPYNAVTRTATVSAGGKTLTLTIIQSVATPYLTWADGTTSNKGASFTSSGGVFRQGYLTNCNISPVAFPNWITDGYYNQSGSGELSGNVTSNSTTTPRSQSLTLTTTGVSPSLSLTYSISQSALGAVYWEASGTQTAASRTVASGKTEGTIVKPVGSGITYHLANNTSITVTSNPNWITVTTGSDVVNYSVAVNTGATVRSGDIVVTGVPNGGSATLSITQEAGAQQRTFSITVENPLRVSYDASHGGTYASSTCSFNFQIGNLFSYNFEGTVSPFTERTITGTGTFTYTGTLSTTAETNYNVTITCNYSPQWGGHGTILEEYFDAYEYQLNTNGQTIINSTLTVPANPMGTNTPIYIESGVVFGLD